MRIYVVRHGQTEWNEQGRMQGAKNSNLTAKGIAEAKKLNSHIRHMDFDRVFVSPLGRTLETMKHLVGDMEIESQVVDELQEMNFGKFEGEVLAELKEKYPEDMEKLWIRPGEYRSETGEIYQDVFKRVELALDKITADDSLDNVIVVTHGVIISVLLSIVKKREIEQVWDTPVVGNTSVSILEYEDGKIRVIEEGNLDHLS